MLSATDLAQAQAIVQRLHQIRAFDPAIWPTLEDPQKVAALDSAIAAIAAVMGIPKPELEIISSYEVALQGAYTTETNTFTYNELALQGGVASWYANPVAVLRTTVYEMRHAYQHFTIREQEKGAGIYDKATTDSWQQNFADYKIAFIDGRVAYENQAVERDARQFAEQVITDLKVTKEQL